MYKLDNIDVRSYGAVPILQKERIALEGLFSFPKRKGESERVWGMSVEPYTDAADMLFDGRSLVLNLWLKGATRDEYVANLDALKRACLTCRSLSTGYASFAVWLKDEVSVKEYTRFNRAVIAASFWQENVSFPTLSVAPTTGEGYSLNGYNLKADFSIGVEERKDNNSIGKRIEADTTAFYTQTAYRNPQSIMLRCWMRGTSYADMYAKMGQFHALCAAPGVKTLRFPEGDSYQGYIKEGFTAKVEHQTKVSFDFKFRVV